jgi:hypothetical protein
MSHDVLAEAAAIIDDGLAHIGHLLEEARAAIQVQEEALAAIEVVRCRYPNLRGDEKPPPDLLAAYLASEVAHERMNIACARVEQVMGRGR